MLGEEPNLTNSRIQFRMTLGRVGGGGVKHVWGWLHCLLPCTWTALMPQLRSYTFNLPPRLC